MKSCFFSAVAIALLASCSGSEVDEVIDNGQPVAINLSGGVQATTVVSRAPITSGSKFTATVLGWEAADATPPAYTSEAKWNSTTEEITASSTAGKITLTAPQYYQSNGFKTYMKAISPVGTATGGIYTFAPVLATDGSVDVLVADAVSGDKVTPVGALAFKHALTQFNFEVKKGEGLGDDVKVTSITLKGAELPTAVNLNDNSLTSVAVSSISALTGGTTVIGDVEAPAGGNPVMVAPIAAANLTLDIVTSAGTFDGVKVTTTGDNFIAGTSYTITLTFQKKKIDTTASVADWVDGTGSGTVE